jgi:hypothetical protein
MRCSECGRPVRTVSRQRRVFGRKQRLHSIKGHDLCKQCWERAWDRLKSQRLEMNAMRPQYQESEFEDIDNLAGSYAPKRTFLPGPEVLPEGLYDFEITSANLTKGGNPPETIFRLGVKVLSGGHRGVELERPTWFRRQESLDYLGGDLCTLGLDADLWGKRGKPWSQELRDACPKLPGIRFSGQIRSGGGEDKNGQPYKNLNILARISGTPMPSTSPRTQVPTPRQQPAMSVATEESIPF